MLRKSAALRRVDCTLRVMQAVRQRLPLVTAVCQVLSEAQAVALAFGQALQPQRC